MLPPDAGPSRHGYSRRGRSRSPIGDRHGDRERRSTSPVGRHRRGSVSRDPSQRRHEKPTTYHSSKHERSPSRSHRSRRRSTSPVRRSNRSPSSHSSSSSQEDRKQSSSKSKRKKSHRHSRHRSSSIDSDDSHQKKESKAERKERKRKKREKKEKKKSKKEHSSKHKGVINEYGKYGIISEADMYTKDQEFRAWMVEEKMMNPETVPQPKMKELFKVYMEDFNTATLPHEKYYALEKYEARMNAIRSGETTGAVDGYDPRADEAALAAQHKRVTKNDGEVYIGRAQLEQLRRIERERVEASRMKRMGMEVKESMGVRYEVD